MTLNNTISNHIKNNRRVAIHNASWLKRFLKTGTYLKLPAANLQQFVSQLQEIPVRGGQNIVTQCAKANHYYIIKEGRGSVTRRSNNQNVNLAVVSVGEGFGEDAIISQQQRNATVTMLETGSVMRLPANSFMSLIVSPTNKLISYEDALLDSVSNKVLIDVRTKERHSNNGLKNSINIPLMLMRNKIQNLHPDQQYILYCDNGQASATAAFILTQDGFTVEYIEGGVALQNTLKSPRKKQSNTKKRSNFALIENENAFEDVDIDIETEIANIQAQLESLADIEETIENTNKTDDAIEENLLCISIPLPETTEKENTHEKLMHGWVDDAALWENMLGYRSDPKIEQLLEAHEDIIVAEEDPSFSDRPIQTARKAVNENQTPPVMTAPPTQTKKKNKLFKYSVTGMVIVLALVGLYQFAFFADEKQSLKKKLNSFTNLITQTTYDFIDDAMTFSTHSAKKIPVTTKNQQKKTREIDLQKKQVALKQSKKDAATELQRKLKLKKTQLSTHADKEKIKVTSNALTAEDSAQTTRPETASTSTAANILNQPEASMIPLTHWTPEANSPTPNID